jgi:site-specific DNA recombinase
MTALGYIRLSDEDQSQYSIEFQQKGISDYCTRNNITLLKTYQDNGQSSYTFDRKAFKNLELQFKTNKPQYLIVYHLDRFSRNMAEAMLKVKDLFAKGIKVRDINEPIDLDDEDPNTFMMRAFKFMNAESELHRIRQRTKSGMVQAAENGRHANMAPYGYVNARDEKGKGIIVIDDERAAAVRMIFREYLNGMGIEECRRLANLHGYNQKSNSAIQRILGNPIYAGFIKVPATRHRPSRLVNGLHAPLISEQDFWLVQERLNGKTISVQNNEEVPLRGVLHCWCGKRVTAGNSKSKSGKYYWYYLCPEHRQNLSANRLHTQFDELLDNLSLDAQTISFFRKKMSDRLKNHLANREDNMKQIRSQLDRIEQRIEATEEKYLRQPDLSEATYNKVMIEYKSERSRLYNELAKCNTNHVAYWNKLEGVLHKLSDIKKLFTEEFDLTQKHKFINWLFYSELSYEHGSYRTPSIHEFFAHKAVILKQKGLLILNSPVIKLRETPIGTPGGNPVEQLEKLLSILSAAM